MAREYWVETSPSGRHRWVKSTTTTTTTKPHRLRRSNTHDGTTAGFVGGAGSPAGDNSSTQSSRSRRVDFLDVTRGEYTKLLAQERRVRADLARENSSLYAKWQASDAEARKLAAENEALRTRLEEERLSHERSASGYYHESSRAREEELRRLRHRYDIVMNENEVLRTRVARLEGMGSHHHRHHQHPIRDGLSDWAAAAKHKIQREFAEEVAAWKRRYTKLEDEAERLYFRLDGAEQRNRRLVAVNESLAKQDRKLRQDVDYYESLLRQKGPWE
ncbi:hypothetical protein BD289DRAFT_16679 [Coniella lustricola]|uniref:Uncharacterized protein n=1 Tax=Coniella lustricola TaxID=2025994 RepID=A0A2T3A3Q8_9PEZI|nr:hypothetical protein BD289DRAFT_16679 [Coniella lustricola]